MAVDMPSTSWRELSRSAGSPASTSPSQPSPRRVPRLRLGVLNATFLTQDLAVLDVADAFDIITVFDAVHDQVQPARVLANIHRALRPGGTLLMADIKASSHLEENIQIPLAPFLYTISTMHCMTVSLAGRYGAGQHVGAAAGDIDAGRCRIQGRRGP